MLPLSDICWISLIGVLYLEIIAGGTTFAAGPVQKNAFNILIEGSQWMIFRNTETGVLHWDFVSLFLLSSVK